MKKKKDKKDAEFQEELNKKIEELLKYTSDFTEDEQNELKKQINNFVKNRRGIRLVFSSTLSFLKALVTRYIVYVLLLGLFFEFIVSERKYEIFIVDLVISLFVTGLGLFVEGSTRFNIKKVLLNLVLGLILTISLGILINNYYTVFTSNFMLAIYLVVASILYNLINFLITSRSIMKGK